MPGPRGEEHHAASEGLSLKLAKRGSGGDSITYAKALEIALCYGWIDSQKAGFDERFFLQRFTPRRALSKWSTINRDKATELIEGGEMQPARLREMELAKADGRWQAAYASQSKAKVAEDLQRELDDNPEAKNFFADLDSANRYAILYRIEEARRPETRRRRIAKYIGMLERGETIH